MSAYGPDYAAAWAGALLQWRGLSCAMRRALRDAVDIRDRWSGLVLCDSCRKPTGLALARRGLVRWSAAGLTPMGMLVREAGLADIKRRTRPKV